MKSLLIVCSIIFVVFTISLMSISTSLPLVEATTNDNTATITVLKNNVATAFVYTGSSTGALIEVDMNKRDAGRFDRFCDHAVVFEDVTLSTQTEICPGKGPWSIEVTVHADSDELHLLVVKAITLK